MTNPQIFAQLSDNTDQTPFDTNPYAVEFSTEDHISGIVHDGAHPEEIVIQEDGVYVVVAAGQVGRRTGSLLRHVDMWMRRNGEDISNTGVRASAPASLFKGDTVVLVVQAAIPCNAGDVLTIMMSVSEKGEGLGLISITPENQPHIPSIILTMYKL